MIYASCFIFSSFFYRIDLFYSFLFSLLQTAKIKNKIKNIELENLALNSSSNKICFNNNNNNNNNDNNKSINSNDVI